MTMKTCDRREFLTCVSAGVAAGAVRLGANPGQPDAEARPPQAAHPPGALRAPAFRPLPLGAIRPSGWLARQLRIQADGLSGHLDEFWPDIGESQWFGGRAEGWERAPYWLDGVIPLAWMLDDQPLKVRITRYLDYIVSHQRADGWFGPYPEDAVAKRYDLWAILLADKMLAQYHDATGDARVLDAVARSLRALLSGLDRTPLYGWGRFRWYEGLVPVFYVYEHTGELEVDEQHPERSVRFEEAPIGERPFSPEGAGVTATVSGRRIPAWTLAHGWAAEISPADAAWADPRRRVSDEPLETVTLIPYGCTNIRITEFPKLRPQPEE